MRNCVYPIVICNMEELSTSELITAVLIHLVIPVLGIVFYVFLVNKMKKANIKNPPNAALFLEFFIYGGLLLIILTSLFWYWSAMASLGFIFVLFIAPFIMLALAIYYLWKRNDSKYHKIAFYLAGLYLPIIAIFYLLIQNKNWKIFSKYLRYCCLSILVAIRKKTYLLILTAINSITSRIKLILWKSTTRQTSII